VSRLVQGAAAEPVLAPPPPPHGDDKISGVECLGLLAVCGLITVQYSIMQSFGIYSAALGAAVQSNVGGFYEAMNLGACALAFVAGLVFDSFGPARASLLGGAIAGGGLLLARTCLLMGFGATSWCAWAGFLTFGFGSSILNSVGVVGAVKAVPARHVGKASAGVLCCAALGMSVHSAVYARWFEGNPFGYLLYQIAYTVFSGALGYSVFRSSVGRRAFAADSAGAAAASTDGAPAAAAASEKGHEDDGLLARVRAAMLNPEMPWLATLFLVPISYSFALLGMWSTCAERLALPTQDRTALALGLGVSSALGRLVLGGLADVFPARRRRLGWELCCAAGLAVFQLGFMLLEWDQRRFLSLALWAQGIGYGGILALAPAALRVSFPAKDLGMVYGLLYQFVAIAFTVFSRTAVPSAGCVGPLCFQGWFRAAGLLNMLCVVWSARRVFRLARQS